MITEELVLNMKVHYDTFHDWTPFSQPKQCSFKRSTKQTKLENPRKKKKEKEKLEKKMI